MLVGVDGTCPLLHGSHPAPKPCMKVDNHLNALHVTQPPTESISQSSSLVVFTSSEHLSSLDRTHSHLVNFMLVATIDITILHSYLRGTATYNKHISRSFDAFDGLGTFFSRFISIKRSFIAAVSHRKALDEQHGYTICIPLPQAFERKSIVA